MAGGGLWGRAPPPKLIYEIFVVCSGFIRTEMKTITVTSSHHWNTDRKFVITLDGHEIKVHCYENDQRHRFSTLAEYLLVLLEMFGNIEDLRIEGGNYAEVYNAVYDIPIPKHYVFINKGFKHLQEKIEFCGLKSFYDFMAKFGLKPHDSEIMWYTKSRGIDYDFETRPFSVIQMG